MRTNSFKTCILPLFGDNPPYLMWRRKFYDKRGAFQVCFDDSFEHTFVQQSVSESERYVFRGLHWQFGDNAQGKLIRVLDGEIIDFACDINPDSSTFGNLIGVRMNPDSPSLYIPAGYAHGYLALTNVEFEYHVTTPYAPASESGAYMPNEVLCAYYPPLRAEIENGENVKRSDKDDKYGRIHFNKMMLITPSSSSCEFETSEIENNFEKPLTSV